MDKVYVAWIIVCLAFGAWCAFAGYVYGRFDGLERAWDLDLEFWKKALNGVFEDLKAGKKSTLRSAAYSGSLRGLIKEMEAENKCSLELHLGPKED